MLLLKSVDVLWLVSVHGKFNFRCPWSSELRVLSKAVCCDSCEPFIIEPDSLIKPHSIVSLSQFLVVMCLTLSLQ